MDCVPSHWYCKTNTISDGVYHFPSHYYLILRLDLSKRELATIMVVFTGHDRLRYSSGRMVSDMC